MRVSIIIVVVAVVVVVVVVVVDVIVVVVVATVWQCDVWVFALRVGFMVVMRRVRYITWLLWWR